MNWVAVLQSEDMQTGALGQCASRPELAKVLELQYSVPLIYLIPWASLVAQRLKCLPAMREIQLRSLGWEDPLGKEMATHSSILAWRIPWREEPGGLQSMGSQRVGHD